MRFFTSRAERMRVGDPADLLLSEEASPEDIADARRRWGLDQPIYVQYVRFLANILSGDLGTSFRTREPVALMLWRNSAR